MQVSCESASYAILRRRPYALPRQSERVWTGAAEKPQGHYLLQLLFLAQPGRLGWVRDLILVVLAVVHTCLGQLHGALQVRLPHGIDIPEDTDSHPKWRGSW